MSEDYKNIIDRRRWQADLIQDHKPPKVGDWDIPKMLREDADEIERLTVDLSAAELRAKTYDEGYSESQKARLYLQARVDELEAGLETFGKHSESCTSVPLFCDCGLLRLKHKALEGENHE